MDEAILTNIHQMVAGEHRLRQELAAGVADPQKARVQLRDLETSLDQTWDLLRQRRARREFDQNPDGATVRPAAVVEQYWS